MHSAQYIKLIIICIFFLISAIGWAYRKFKEQQARQAAKNEALRRREEMLRTGRADDPASRAPSVVLTAQPSVQPATVHDEARRRLQELAAQRRRELEAMARRAAGTPTAPARSPQLPPSPPPLRPGTLASPGQFAPAPKNSRSVPIPTRGQPANKARDLARQQANRAAKAAEARRQVDRQTADRDQRESDRREADAEADRASEAVYHAPPPPAAPLAALLAPVDTVGGAPSVAAGALRSMVTGSQGSRQDWRRAIVMLELLGPPVGLRHPNGDDRVI